MYNCQLNCDSCMWAERYFYAHGLRSVCIRPFDVFRSCTCCMLHYIHHFDFSCMVIELLFSHTLIEQSWLLGIWTNNILTYIDWDVFLVYGDWAVVLTHTDWQSWLLGIWTTWSGISLFLCPFKVILEHLHIHMYMQISCKLHVQ